MSLGAVGAAILILAGQAEAQAGTGAVAYRPVAAPTPGASSICPDGLCGETALEGLFQALEATEAGARDRPVHILQIGDSHTAGDRITNGSLIAIKNLGLKVPEDLAVIAFTDGIISKYSTPSITTVSQSGEKMGNKAAKMLIERLEAEHDDDEEENENYTTEVIETHLIKRESTD